MVGSLLNLLFQTGRHREAYFLRQDVHTTISRRGHLESEDAVAGIPKGLLPHVRWRSGRGGAEYLRWKLE